MKEIDTTYVYLLSKISIWKNPWKYFIARFRAITDFFPRVIARFLVFREFTHGSPKIRDVYVASIAAFFADIPDFAVCNTICNTYKQIEAQRHGYKSLIK